MIIYRRSQQIKKEAVFQRPTQKPEKASSFYPQTLVLNVEQTHITIKGRKVPAKIYREFRRNVRASIGKKAVILRLPQLVDFSEQKKHFAWFTEWVALQFDKNPALHNRFFGKNYQDGDTLTVGQKTYRIQIEKTDRKTHAGKLLNGIIHLKISQQDSGPHLQRSIKHLLSRVVAQDHLPAIERRVLELNRLYFRKDIKSVSLKYNQSNWGSCSTQGNINLSTRLLFAPPEVIDYVIIHELAHLIEMNHSKRFWKLVSEAMPDYKAKEKWLKDYGEHCNF